MVTKQLIGDTIGELSVVRHNSTVVISAKDDMFRPYGIVILDLITGSLSGMLVEEQYRHKGVMAVLLGEAERIAREAGLDRIQASTHPDNHIVIDMLDNLGYFRLTTMEKRI